MSFQTLFPVFPTLPLTSVEKTLVLDLSDTMPVAISNLKDQFSRLPSSNIP